MYKQRIWDSLLDADRMSRYYGAKADQFQWLHMLVNAALIMSSIGAATLLLVFDTRVWSAGLFFLTAALTTVSIVVDPSGRANTAKLIAGQLREVELQLRSLWYDDHPNLKMLQMLEQRIESAVRDDPFFFSDKKLNERCNKAAYAAMENHYGKEPQSGYVSS